MYLPYRRLTLSLCHEKTSTELTKESCVRLTNMRNILNVLEFNIYLNPRMFPMIWRSAHINSQRVEIEITVITTNWEKSMVCEKIYLEILVGSLFFQISSTT